MVSETKKKKTHLNNPYLLISEICLIIETQMVLKEGDTSPTLVLHFFGTSTVYVFDSICVFDTGLYTMQEPTYLSKIVLETICLEMVLTQIITHVYKDSITITYPTKSNI